MHTYIHFHAKLTSLLPAFIGRARRTTDLTTLYATATFWTYGFSLLLLKTRLSSLTLTAIMVAFLGVAVITYSGASESSNQHHHQRNDTANSDPASTRPAEGQGPPHRVLGDLIMLAGAICLGFYEVVYKMSLPEGHGGVGSPPDGEAYDSTTTTPAAAGNSYEAVSTTMEDESVDEQPKPTGRPTFSVIDHRSASSLPLVRQDTARFRHQQEQQQQQQELKLPLALHANFLTSLIGIATLLLFWIPIPLLHWTGLEEFELPRSEDAGLLVVICTMGATYVSLRRRLVRLEVRPVLN